MIVILLIHWALPAWVQIASLSSYHRNIDKLI